MEIHFHAHHAEVSDARVRRAERLVLRAAERIPRVVQAVVRFELDGNTRRVTVELKAPRNHGLIGTGEARYWGPALAGAIARIEGQASRERRILPKDRAHRQSRARL